MYTYTVGAINNYCYSLDSNDDNNNNNNNNNNNDKTLSGGATAGIVIGSLAIIGIGILAAYYFFVVSKNNAKKAPEVDVSSMPSVSNPVVSSAPKSGETPERSEIINDL